ncbi:hypothetical protein HK405_000088 [Cladochytrium tenue]|nr:hypothetical protein HK405_000088 [Cladochytrium tenue]
MFIHHSERRNEYDAEPTGTPGPSAELPDPKLLPHIEEPHTIFDARQKKLIIALISIAATFSGFASNIYFPALTTVSTDLGISISLANLTVTTYLILQGLAPSVWGPISDTQGRRVAYVGTFAVFLGACIGLALTHNYAGLMVLRCVQSAGSASTIAIGSGVLGDITTREERGGYMGVFQAGLLLPVAVGPVIGGALSGALEVAEESKTRKRIDIVGPLRILTSKHAAPIILFLAVYYAVWQMSITALASLFASEYGLSETQVGLTYIANGAGCILGTLFTGKILDNDYSRVQRCLSVLLLGWTIRFPDKVPLAIPIITTFVTGWTAIGTQSLVMTYLVDVFPTRSAAASAALNLARCMFAAGGTSFILPLVEAVGAGWAFTVCVGLQILALAGAGVQVKWAGTWRAQAEVMGAEDK